MLRCLLFASLAGAVAAQAPDTSLTFEVASVRPAGHRSADDTPGQGSGGGRLGGPGTGNPGRIFYFGATLQRLVMDAFEVQADQISGPEWLASEKFDITANVAKRTSKEQSDVMLQNLLVERFKLSFHKITKDGPVYDLTVASGGPKLAPAATGGRRGVQSARLSNGLVRRTCRSCAIAELIRAVQGFDAARLAPDRLVDKTGLTGRYQFTLEYLQSSVNTLKLSAIQSQAHSGQDVFTALETQLGLKAEKGQGPEEVLVIDHIDKTATEN